jgi:hypothetical protein
MLAYPGELFLDRRRSDLAAPRMRRDPRILIELLLAPLAPAQRVSAPGVLRSE